MGTLDLHVVPIRDLVPHAESDACWCQPQIERVHDQRVIVHHSADGREDRDVDPLSLVRES